MKFSCQFPVVFHLPIFSLSSCSLYALPFSYCMGAPFVSISSNLSCSSPSFSKAYWRSYVCFLWNICFFIFVDTITLDSFKISILCLVKVSLRKCQPYMHGIVCIVDISGQSTCCRYFYTCNMLFVQLF